MAQGHPVKTGATLLTFPHTADNVRGQLRGALARHRLPELLAGELIRDAGAWPGYTPAEALACALAKRMHPAAIDFQNTRGILLLGPTAAGKSAVAAKIVHHARLASRSAEQIDVNEGLALFRSDAPPGDTLLVMEAKGFNPANPRAASAFAALGEFHGVDSIGVVSATGDALDTAEIVAALRFKRIIVTGLDSTTRLGAVIAAITGQARLAHVTRGPRPDDALESPEPDELAKLLLH
jgi:flagellar biosynthesis GTPase FlhF